MATWADVILASLQDLGVLQAGETPSSEDQATVLLRARRLLDQWAGENLIIFYQTRSTWSITSGDETYTIGSSGDVNIVRPMFIEHVYFQDTSFSPTLEMPLQPLTDDAYAKIPQKDLESTYPTSWYYNPTFPLGTLTFWPVPTSSTIQGVLYARTALADVTSTATTFTLPPGYQRMVETNLALEIAPLFNATPSPVLIKLAMDSKQLVERENTRMMDLSVDTAALGQTARGWTNWSIRTGP